MGQLFAMECDICLVQQVVRKAHELRGKTYQENGVQKFACSECEALFKAATEIKKDGLRDPLKKVAGLIEERDKALRYREEAMAALEGKHPFAGTMIGDPNLGLRQLKPGQPVPVLGMTRPPAERFQPELPDRTRKESEGDDKDKKDGKKGKKDGGKGK